jgi:penicillin-binding protein 1A
MRKLFLGFAILMLVALVAVGGGVYYIFHRYGSDLPDYHQLADYAPPTVTRVHAGDGRLLAEYATEKRVFVPINAIPRRVINAFLAAEDKSFYEHSGVDFRSVFRAAITNLVNLGSDRRPVGASTITQQVAKNFLLSGELSYERKIREAILAFRIEKAFTKDQILELYLNEIYLGVGSYGVAAAALNYFNKSLDELTIGEAAFLGALPKAPNNYNPMRYHKAAVERRNWVIKRMLEDGRITQEEADSALAETLVVRDRSAAEVAEADYFAEDVRRQLVGLFGEQSLYNGGLSVRTTLDPDLEVIADQALQEGLIAYDRRHGWRGPVAHIDPTTSEWASALGALDIVGGRDTWRLALVGTVGKTSVQVGFADGTRGIVPFAEMKWARPWKEKQRVGKTPSKPADVLKAGDVVYVEPVTEAADGTAYDADTYALRQVPAVNGAIVALDPHTGRVLAMSGGFSFAASEFDRATQAERQPGSAFKPFVYLAALAKGFSPTTIILDAPIVIDQGDRLGKWKPTNYSSRFYGPSTMRLGIEKSRNLMTVRLARTIGMDTVADFAERFGITAHMPKMLSMALGAGETTLLRLTAAYGMLVNGGRKIEPTFIDRVQDRLGRTVYRHDQRTCDACQNVSWHGQGMPDIRDNREQLVDSASAFQIVSMLEGVVKRGTGAKVLGDLDFPLAGKTGTTNDSFDAWFVGFSPDLAVGVYVGFDQPQTLGPRETGSSVAAPIFRTFMEAALKGKPAIPFRVPPGIRLVRINSQTGALAQAGDDKVILEALKPGNRLNDPQLTSSSGGYVPPSATGETTTTGVGGLY